MPGQTRLISEIFTEISAAQTPEEKAHILRANERKSLIVVLQAMFADNVHFIYKTPEQIPQYVPAPDIGGTGYLTIDNAVSDLYLFIENNPLVKAPRARLDELYIQILEGLEPADALVWIAMTLKQPISGLTKSIVQTAFPNIGI